ncbi:MAG: hypothetical protein ACI90V_009086 [Bacillariaceae sp.]|jgi:hypothetical protein
MYFEAHPSKLKNDAGPPLYGQIFTNVPDGNIACDEEGGTLIATTSITFENDDYLEAIPNPYDEYEVLHQGPGRSFPQTSNGRIGVTRFSFEPDPFSSLDASTGDKQMWFPNRGEKDGTS